jgi:hypothetical protein
MQDGDGVVRVDFGAKRQQEPEVKIESSKQVGTTADGKPIHEVEGVVEVPASEFAESPMQVLVDKEKGLVVLDLGRVTRWVALTPAMAKRLGDELKIKAVLTPRKKR